MPKSRRETRKERNVVTLLLFLLTMALPQTHPRTENGHFLPDSAVTPGVVRSTDAHEVCTTSTRKYRHTTAQMKKQVCMAYGVAHCPWQGHMEIDHLIPLELGGADDVKNLWPEPAPDFHVKDKVENRLHALVCTGKMKITDAQDLIRTDWTRGIGK
jgi:hypothetical protein